MSVLIAFIFLSQVVFAKEILFKREVKTTIAPTEQNRLESRTRISSIKEESLPRGKTPPKEASGNLDKESIPRDSYFAEGSHTVLPAKVVPRTYPGLRRGDLIPAIISEGIIALPDGRTPVRAKVVGGSLKGGVFLGEANLENNTKRTLIEFKTFLPNGSRDEYSIAGSVLNAEGLLGLEGEYKTQEGKFFAAEFLSAVAAGMAEASISRTQNAWGNYQEVPSMNTITKKAAANSLSKTTDRLAEKVRTAPSYSVLYGPTIIQILLE